MSKYETSQRQVMFEFFEEHPHEAFSARQLATVLKPNGISQSAVYRNLATLEQEGIVVRTLRAGSREALFRYTNSSHCANLLHLICTACGEVSHPSHSPTQTFLVDLFEGDGFVLDKAKTVLYGLCRQCSATACK